MAESYINSIGRLRVVEKRLLSQEQLSRAAASDSYSEAMRLITEAGYGHIADTDGGDDIEHLIESEMASAYAFVDELTLGSGTTDVFRMRSDITNIKLLMKLRLQKSDETPRLQVGGIYSESTLKNGVASGDYSFLPKQIANALERLDVSMYKHPDPRRLSTAVDSAYIGYALSIKNSFVREYFKATADFDNIAVLLRMKAMGAAQSQYEDCLLPAGNISRELLESAYSFTDDAVASNVIFNIFEQDDEVRREREVLRAAFFKALRGGSAAAEGGAACANADIFVLERERDGYLMSLAAKHKNDINTVAPIVGYMLAKEREAHCVRLILTCLRNNLPQTVIEERMSGALYG